MKHELCSPDSKLTLKNTEARNFVFSRGWESLVRTLGFAVDYGDITRVEAANLLKAVENSITEDYQQELLDRREGRERDAQDPARRKQARRATRQPRRNAPQRGEEVA
jgi:hypothetical protein